MLIEFKLQEIAGNVKEAKITELNIKPGDKVTVGDILCYIEANKSSMDITSDSEGIIKDIYVAEGDTVKIGDLLMTIEGEKIETKQAPSLDYFNNMFKPIKKELTTNITIIGGGPGGYVAAIKAAQLGADVVLIEKDVVGGTCLNRGCIPTKALVRSAEIYSHLKNADHFGCSATNISLDMKKVMARKTTVVNQLVQGIKYLLTKHNVKVIEGTGKIIDEKTVLVKNANQETTITTNNIIIATGSKTAKLPIPGSDIPNVIDSTTALELEELPKKLVIIGGGVIGMEFAFIYANFGVDVTVIEYLDEILTACDKDIIEEISKIATNMGIKLYTGSRVKEIIKSEDQQCIVAFDENEETKYLTADKVLMAVGREPFYQELGLEELNIELNDKGKGIKVNDKMLTNIPHIYAIGDVTNKIQLAHVASHQGIIAVQNILGINSVMDYSVIPSAIFTEPEIATVGINEKYADQANIAINVGKFPFAANGKAQTYGETRGFVKLIQEKESGKIIGGSIIGPHATDLLGEITLAIKNNLTAEQIMETIHAHPTTAESIHEAALSLEGGALHFAD